MKHALRVVSLALGLAVALSIVGCGGQGATEEVSQSAEPVKIGAVLSLTGTYAGLGAAEKQALDLEVKRANDAGGIDGRQIELVIEDDATDEAKAVAAASKLIEQDNVVAILGASGTGQSMAMRGDIDRAGVPLISMAGGTVITQKFDPQVFQTPWSNTIVVPFVLDAIKAAGHTDIALLSDTGGYGKDGKPLIETSAAEKGLKIVASETFNPGDADMTAQLTKIRSSGADAVLIWTAGKEAATIMKNAEALGMREGDGVVPFFGGSGQARVEFAEGAGPAAEGFVFGTGKSLVPNNWGVDSEAYKVVNDFSTRYRQAYGQDPDIFAGHAFDAFSILTRALKTAGPDADAAALRDAIEGTQGLVGFGGTFGFSAQDHNGLTTDDLALYRIENGVWEPVE